MKQVVPLTFTPLYPDHLQRLKVGPGQTDEYNALLTQSGIDSLATCTGLTAWAGAQCVGLAGVFPLWHDRAEAWCLFSGEATHYILQTLPKFKYMLDNLPFRRIELTVKSRNVQGHKFARHLGFGGTLDVPLPSGKTVKAEGFLRGYWPLGDDRDVVIYSRIRTT